MIFHLGQCIIKNLLSFLSCRFSHYMIIYHYHFSYHVIISMFLLCTIRSLSQLIDYASRSSFTSLMRPPCLPSSPSHSSQDVQLYLTFFSHLLLSCSSSSRECLRVALCHANQDDSTFPLLALEVGLGAGE